MRIVVNLLRIPNNYLMPIVFVLATIGAYALRNSTFDVVIMLAAGIAGFFLRRRGYSPASIVLGSILGSLGESALAKSMQLSTYDWTIFFSRPFAAFFMISGIIAILGSMAYGRVVNGRNRFKSMYISTTVLAAGALMLRLNGAVPVILFAMLNSFFGGFLNNPAGSIFYATIELPAHADYQGEFNGIREMTLSVGKALGIAFTMYFAGLLSPGIAILILTLSQYLMIVLQIPIQKVLDKHQSELK